MSRNSEFFAKSLLARMAGSTWRASVWLAAIVVVAAMLGACGPGEPEEDPREAERQAMFSEIEEAERALEQKRERVEEISQQLMADVEQAADATEEALDPEALRQEADELTSAVYEDAYELGMKVSEFINTAELEVGGDMPARVERAVRMKSKTDMLLAEEHIQRGGDYAKAIGIYETALMTDPENADLHAALEEARSLRWMGEERFARAKKGMTEAEVRRALGPPNAHNIKEYTEKNAKAWFYPKGEDRAAAAVYFQKKGDGPYKVYKLDYNAVKAQG